MDQASFTKRLSQVKGSDSTHCNPGSGGGTFLRPVVSSPSFGQDGVSVAVRLPLAGTGLWYFLVVLGVMLAIGLLTPVGRKTIQRRMLPPDS